MQSLYQQVATHYNIDDNYSIRVLYSFCTEWPYIL